MKFRGSRKVIVHASLKLAVLIISQIKLSDYQNLTKAKSGRSTLSFEILRHYFGLTHNYFVWQWQCMGTQSEANQEKFYRYCYL